MKISLLYNTTEKPWGGINTFFRNFEQCLEKDKEHELVMNYKDADIILSSGNYYAPGKLLRKFHLNNLKSGRHILNPFGFFISKQRQTKMVFRVDGLRFFYTGKMNISDEILLDNMLFADSIVFQSSFSRNCFDELQAEYAENNCIVRNGANKWNFFLSKKIPDRSSGITLISNCWSVNENKGFETIAAFSKLKDTEVLHIGRWPEHISTESVKLLGLMDEKEIGETLRKGHFLLFPSKNEACPNVVLEALACGIPVLYHQSGGTPEICKKERFGLPLPPFPNKDRTYLAFLQYAIGQYSKLRKAITSQRHIFGFEHCYKQYIQHFKEIISK